MAEATTIPAKKKAPTRKAPAAKFITETQLNAALENLSKEMVNAVAKLVAKPEDNTVAAPAVAAQPETPLEKEVRKAAPNKVETNPEWEEVARDILGDSLDHTEYQYLKTGGVLFTVVIEKGASNAPTDYLERMGQDRRSKEIGQEGTSGVEGWCKLIKQNLAKPR